MAEDILKKLANGDEFDNLASDFSKCPSGKSGGHLGEFGKGMMVAPFEDAAFSLEVGDVSGPVRTQFGYHIIKRNS
ncbi:MAG: peptidylprolyl isomerase [Bdellovibrionales bacterium]|nr:peptidylprolyl isomerase [Bdellovibrionales bacterium]